MLGVLTSYFLLSNIVFFDTTAGLALNGEGDLIHGNKISYTHCTRPILRLFNRYKLSLRASEDAFLRAVVGDESSSQVPISDSDAIHGPNIACTDPKVRKEWRSLTPLQKEEWIGAVNCLARLPASGKLTPTGTRTDNPIYALPAVNQSASWYDDFAYAHLDLSTQTHQTGLFFPWHRYFLWSFEQTLKNNCGYTGTSPYWNWTKDANDFAHASIWDAHPKTGLGGFGDPAHDDAVSDGAFAGLPLSYPTVHTLRRKYTPYPYVNMTPPLFTNHTVPAASTFTSREVHNLVSGYQGNFNGFQTYFESSEGMHMSVHFIMGGDMSGVCPGLPFSECATDATPNEPMFWMHHAMVDKVWYDWQHAHPENYWAFEGGTVRDLKTWPKYPTGRPPAMTPKFRLPNDGLLFGNYTVGDMFNTTSNRPLCYTYE